MKRYLAIFAVALSLGGCAGTLPPVVEKIIGLPAGVLTTDIQQPVTRKMYRNASNTLILAAVGLNIYKDKCERGQIAASCIAVVEQAQGYIAKARPVLKNVRIFIRKNDQVNARLAYNTAIAIISDLKKTSALAGAI